MQGVSDNQYQSFISKLYDTGCWVKIMYKPYAKYQLVVLLFPGTNH